MRTKQIHKQSAKTTYNASHNQQAYLLTIGKPIFDLWSSLLTLGRTQARLVLLSLNRSLKG
jgi:hypothetical protein